MPRFEPFPGIRYAVDDPAEVTAPPYDVIDAAERAELVARHEHNVVRIDLPVAGGSDEGDPYVEAASTFTRWQREGVLTEDEPSFYPYRMTFTDEAGVRRQTLGVLGALGLGADERRDVLPHEHTTPKAKSDRLQLLRTTRANLSPIWGLSLTPGLTARLGLDRAEALGSWTDAEGVLHELWRLREPAAVKAVSDAVAAPSLVIADGHHRYETCLTYAAEAGAPAGAAATLCLVVELDDEQLTVAPIHRLIAGLEGTDLQAALSPYFVAGDLEPLPDGAVVGRLVAEGALGLVTPDGFRLLRPDDAVLTAAGAEGGASMLDSVRIGTALANLPAHELTYQHGVVHAVAAVREGRAQGAVLLRPVSVEQIRLTAYSRGRMPPKSTFFWPKPRTGAVFRSLDE
jgi:uncharacterized protein (DUF1015 family)